MDYQLISRANVPQRALTKCREWIVVIAQLHENEAMKVEVGSVFEARCVQSNVQGALRYERRKKHNFNFHIRTRTSRLENGKAILYIWKEG